MSKPQQASKPKSIFNDSDMGKIGQVVADMIWDAVPQIVSGIIKPEIERLEEKIEHLPTKDEFYTENDKLAGMLKREEEQQDLLLSFPISAVYSLDYNNKYTSPLLR